MVSMGRYEQAMTMFTYGRKLFTPLRILTPFLRTLALLRSASQDVQSYHFRVREAADQHTVQDVGLVFVHVVCRPEPLYEFDVRVFRFQKLGVRSWIY